MSIENSVTRVTVRHYEACPNTWVIPSDQFSIRSGQPFFCITFLHFNFALCYQFHSRISIFAVKKWLGSYRKSWRRNIWRKWCQKWCHNVKKIYFLALSNHVEMPVFYTKKKNNLKKATFRKYRAQMSRLMTKPTKWHVRPAKTHSLIRVFAVRMKKAWGLGPKLPIERKQRL